eukprot:NODE_2597_length_461_cov_256.245146_g2151_i0.p1 GENE.NODE_2597_length_461_cov_256.245146_g2151_i0~~NODE_2597_length_461_cov_256.245146_g2151_i0.p1  ORF type:complete len:87 (+),score=9.79 NODE_2597_length_461_cov_256.245146_g2151_i0:80-340(+)
MSVTELKTALRRLGIDFSDCFEKSEMVARLTAATHTRSFPTVAVDELKTMPVKHLKDLLLQRGVDISDCFDKNDLIQKFVEFQKES